MFALVVVAAVAFPGGQEARVDGKVVAVNAERREVTFKRATGKETTVKLAADCELRLDGKDCKFDRIAKGQAIRAVYDPESKACRWFGIYVELDPPGR